MACFSITKYGFLTIEELIDDVVQVMTGTSPLNATAYFEVKFDGTPTVGGGKTAKMSRY